MTKQERIAAVGAIFRLAMEEHYGCEIRFVTKKKPEVAASGLNKTSGEKFVREGV